MAKNILQKPCVLYVTITQSEGSTSAYLACNIDKSYILEAGFGKFDLHSAEVYHINYEYEKV